DRTAVLTERTGIELAGHDPFHRDRDISGGAALSNLVLAVRNAGWDVDISRSAEDDDLVAEVVATAPSPPEEAERRRYAAIPARTATTSPTSAGWRRGWRRISRTQEWAYRPGRWARRACPPSG